MKYQKVQKPVDEREKLEQARAFKQRFDALLKEYAIEQDDLAELVSTLLGYGLWQQDLVPGTQHP